MWFTREDIEKYKYKPIFVDNLQGYVLPHAGTTYSGEILAHSLRFRPKKEFDYVVIFYLPSQQKPNVGKYYHEFYVPLKALQLYYPNKKYIGYNVLENNTDLQNYTKENTLFVVSADGSHFLEMQDALKKENCAVHSLMHKSLRQCSYVMDDVRTFKAMYKKIPSIVLQWIGRTRSPGKKAVGYISFLIRDKPNPRFKTPNGLFVTAYDKDMRQRECLGNTTMWNPQIEKELIENVIHKASTTSRLTGGMYLNVPITNYTITYLYKDNTKKFIRGWHAISKDALYLPDVFLENTYNNGNWIQQNDIQWQSGTQFKMKPTFKKLIQKAGHERSMDYTLYYTEDIHKRIIKNNNFNYENQNNRNNHTKKTKKNKQKK